MTYENMKDSGIPWIGQIPCHWGIIRAKTIFENISIRNHPDSMVLSLYRDLGIVPKESRDDNHNVTSEDTNQYKYVNIGDLVINKMKAWQGSLAVSDYAGIVSPAYYVCRFRDNSFDKRYCHYLLRCVAYAQEFECLSTGMRVGQWDLGIHDFLTTPILMPDKEEQEYIGNYLDNRCAEIDTVIDEATTSVEQYKRWKASVIYQAVTKGLSLNADVRNSGFSWIGDIKSGVSVSRVGLHFDITLGKMLCPSQIDSSYTLEPYYCAANVHFEGIEGSDLKEMWFNQEEKERYLVKQGDLLVVEGGAGAGGCAVVQDTRENVYIQNSIMIARPKKDQDIRFLRYLIEMVVNRGYMDYICNKATIPHFTKEKLAAMPYPVFEPQETVTISDYLDEQCSHINAIIAEKESLIAELESYKKSLIYEAVTGKRKVE